MAANSVTLACLHIRLELCGSYRASYQKGLGIMERTINRRSSWLKTIVISLIAVWLVVGGVVVFFIYPRTGPLPNFTDRNIAGATSITSGWLEIKPDPVLKVSGKTPLVILELEGDYAPDFGAQELRYPDGTLTVPELQLIDEQGNVFPLHFLMVHHRDRTGSNAMGGAGFGSLELPRDRSYVKLRIRSEPPMKVSGIIWRG